MRCKIDSRKSFVSAANHPVKRGKGARLHPWIQNLPYPQQKSCALTSKYKSKSKNFAH